MIHPYYADTAEKMVQRILETIPAHQEILSMNDPWELFQVKSFKCNDIDASLFQAGWALQEAKRRYKEMK
jgi:hypothetical protein